MSRLIAEAIAKFGASVLEDPRVAPHVRDTLRDIAACRTPEMGSIMLECPHCGEFFTEYRSCRNRACPYCGGMNRLRWIQRMEELILPATYFHVVFTVPDTLNPVSLAHRREFFDSLFRSSARTISELAAEKNVRLGFTSVLHTWGSQLSWHPHIHMIVCSIGEELGKRGSLKRLPWVNMGGKSDKMKFLFPAQRMSEKFKALILKDLHDKGLITKRIREECHQKAWVVYAKDPMYGSSKFKSDEEAAKTVVGYIGRYVNGMAIGESRMLKVDDECVSFMYKDYRDGGKKKEMELPGAEFVRRLAMHVPPKGMARIRHYGIMSPAARKSLAALQEALDVEPVEMGKKRATVGEVMRKAGIVITRFCPHCGAQFTLMPVTMSVAESARPPTREAG